MHRSLLELTESAGLPQRRLLGDPSVEITSVTLDSRAAVRGSLFCCIPGALNDGHSFAAQAVDRGAVALLVERELPLAVPQVVVDDARRATGLLAAALHGHPSRSLQLIGVTGTNGKTTTTHLIADVFAAAGRRCGVIGTLNGRHTTPEAPELQQRLADFRAEGVSAVAMEVSSHALVMHRVAGCRFTVAVFTNLGRDHLDLHGTVEQYFAAKARLFRPDLCERAVVNVDDVHGRILLDAAEVPTIGFSLDEVDDLHVTPMWHRYRWRGRTVQVPIGGRHNAYNSLAAATAAEALGVDLDSIVDGLAAARPVPGRFESIASTLQFSVIVDYAHTPDGLEAALAAAREGCEGRVIVVFGCGGDRDRDKRPEMGAVAARLADRVIVTSDNPRSEDPAAIIDAVMEGVPGDYRARVVTDIDRRRAFETAFHLAEPGDIVLIAGKGHESTQTIGASVVPFDDRDVARSILEAMS